MKISRQVKLEKIQLAAKLLETKNIDEVACILGVAPATVKHYKSAAKNKKFEDKGTIALSCELCDADNVPLIKFRRQWVCEGCLIPPDRTDVADHMGRHTETIDSF